MTTSKCLINFQSKNTSIETFDLAKVRGTYAWDLIYAAAGMAGEKISKQLETPSPHIPYLRGFCQGIVTRDTTSLGHRSSDPSSAPAYFALFPKTLEIHIPLSQVTSSGHRGIPKHLWRSDHASQVPEQ